VPAYGPQNDVTLKMPAFEWVHVQLHQQKGMISLSPPTICNSAVNIYSKRMQIEETFRDLKSPAYGLGLRHSRTSSSERFDIMLLIALMLQLTCWLAGVHAQKQGWDKHFQANTVRNRNVLSTVRLGMEVLRHSGYTITREDLLVAATLLAQNLFTHGYALGKL
ncbi:MULTISPECIES: transposase, partial [Enterobacteriaceae]